MDDAAPIQPARLTSNIIAELRFERRVTLDRLLQSYLGIAGLRRKTGGQMPIRSDFPGDFIASDAKAAVARPCGTDRLSLVSDFVTGIDEKV